MGPNPRSPRRVVVALAGLCLVAACAPERTPSPPHPELVGADPVSAEPDPSDAEGLPPGAANGVLDGLLNGVPGGASGVPEGASGGATESRTEGWTAVEASLWSDIEAGGSIAASMAVAVDGDVVWATASGPRALDDPRPATATSRFRIASISKVVTAIVVLQLVEEGLVGLEEPVGERLAAYVGVTPTDPDVAAITPEHLLAHTSGLPRAESMFFGGRDLTCPGVAATVLRGSVATPGGAMTYSNVNSCLAGLLIEVLTGRPHVEIVHERLLVPLGISGMRQAGTYDVGPDEAEHPSRPGRNYMEALGSAGAWVASAADVVRVLDAINPATPGWSPLGDEMLERMRRPPHGRIMGGYGLGLILYPDGSVGHTGTLENTHAMALTRPDGVTWAVLVNGEHPSDSSRLRAYVDRALAAGFGAG